MKIKSIEWKNIFAYGEEIQKVEYVDGELVLLKGQSGAGKSAILSLPALLLYGKLEKLTKSAIANRTNKNGWIKGIIEKGNHVYTIERGFSPNSLVILKDGINIDSFGISSAQDYIDTEIADIPLPTFSNMISISMKKFKSFLTMSPADRKQIIDRVFNLEVINIAFEKIKKEAKEIGNSINNGNTTLFQLNQTLQNANNQLINIKNNAMTDEMKQEVSENLEKISKYNDALTTLSNALTEYNNKMQEHITYINQLRQNEYAIESDIRTIDEKINLFSQSKCPTCGTSFDSDAFVGLKKQLEDLKQQKQILKGQINNQLLEGNSNYDEITGMIRKINDKTTEYKNAVNTLTNRNNYIDAQSKVSSECQGIQNIIDSTTEQIQAIQNELSDNTIKLRDLQILQTVYSIDGVKQKVINNYIPILNKEIADNLDFVNFPYQLEIDSKFEPHLKELGTDVSPETLSDGEETRVDLIILCSLFKLLKRRFPTINILSIDEVISSLDSESSGLVLDFLKHFAKENNLSCFIVSHTDLFLDNFDKIINVTKQGFSKVNIEIPTL